MSDEILEAKECTFTKSQLLKSKKYKKYRDLLSSILSPEKEYTIKEIDTKINEFLKGK